MEAGFREAGWASASAEVGIVGVQCGGGLGAPGWKLWGRNSGRLRMRVLGGGGPAGEAPGAGMGGGQYLPISSLTS